MRHNLVRYLTEEGEMELSKQFLLYCPAFVELRLKYLGRPTFGGPCEMDDLVISRLHKFAESFVDL